MLLESDRERIQRIMTNAMETRARRSTPPVRDEVTIANVLKDAETRANVQHQLLVESQSLDTGVGTKPQTPVNRSQSLRVFLEMTDWKRRFEASDKIQGS